MQAFIIALGHVVNKGIVVVAGIALLIFLWGLAQFIFKKGDEKAVAEGRNIMVWGIIALFVMFSTWGIVNFMVKALGVTLSGYVDNPSGSGTNAGGSGNGLGGGSGDGCVDAFGNPTYAGDCGTF